MVNKNYLSVKCNCIRHCKQMFLSTALRCNAKAVPFNYVLSLFYHYITVDKLKHGSCNSQTKQNQISY